MLFLVQGVEEIDKEELNDVPPNIPPLPHSHLQALQNRSPEKGSVAKMISRFQEGGATNHINVNIIFIDVFLFLICLYVCFVFMLA